MCTKVHIQFMNLRNKRIRNLPERHQLSIGSNRVTFTLTSSQAIHKMNKALGIFLIFAIAFQVKYKHNSLTFTKQFLTPFLQATTASPQIIIPNPFDPLANFFTSVGNALTGAAKAVVDNIATVVKSFSTTMNAVASNLGTIPKAGYTFVLEMMKVTDSATDAAIAKVRQRLADLSAAAKLPSIVQLIKDTVNSVSVLPSQIAATLGGGVTDVVKGLQDLANSTAPKETVEASIKAFDEFVKLITNGITDLGGSVSLAALSADLNKSIENLITPLAKLAQSTNADVKNLANQALINVNKLIDGVTSTIETIVNEAISATSTVSNALKNAVQNIAGEILRVTGNALKDVGDLATAAFEAKVQADLFILNQTLNVYNSVKAGITSLNLKLAPLATNLRNAITEATNLAINTRARLQTMINTFLADAQKSADLLSAKLNAMFTDATANIQAALNSTSAVARECAQTALDSAEESLNLAQNDFLNCASGFEPSIRSALNGTLNQVTNAFDNASEFFDHTSECIKQFQAGTLYNAQATACLPLSSAFKSTLKTIDTGLGLLFSDLSATANNLAQGVQTCYNTNVASAQTRFDGIVATFEACTPALAA